MTNDLLPLPDMLPESPRSDSAAPDMSAAGRWPGFVTEYPSGGGREADTQRLLATIARLEAAIRKPQPEVPAALASGLRELAEAVARIEATLSATEASAPNIHFAIEHIQDIAMALRQRDVESSLCDTLEAAIRDVGDAIMRGDAAAACALSAAAMLRNLAGRFNELSAVAAEAAAQAEHASASATESWEAGTNGSPPMANFPRSSEAQSGSVALAQEAMLPAPLPDMQAAPEKHELSSGPFYRLPLSIPSPIESDDGVVATSHGVDDADDVTATRNEPTRNEEPATLTVPQPLDVTAAPNSRASTNDPLAPLYALSEEELIALFS